MMETTDVKGFLIDLDGVLYTGDVPITGAQKALSFLTDQGYTFRCVSNSTRKCRAAIAARLEKMGFDIPARMIFTPPVAAVRYMQETGKHRAYLLTTEDVEQDFTGTCVDDGSTTVDYVVVGDAGDRVTYASMNHAFRCLMNGAGLIALEKDRYWMAHDGLSLSAGPFVTALESATGKIATVVGKPSKAFFDLALRDMGLEAGSVVMIGDDIFTDIGGAQAVGMQGVLVQTGKFRKEILDLADVKPDAVICSIRDLGSIL
ncbi:MAG TPA: TIGR01458 family HAD-type hydrolase [Methanoregula sp.]|nr:TIGR01458 family HAD-type hydrolase [Methanoregula sp.]